MKISIGDPVEVRKVSYAPMTESALPNIVWIPGACCVGEDNGRIGVAYANGDREMVEGGNYRATPLGETLEATRPKLRVVGRDD